MSNEREARYAEAIGAIDFREHLSNADRVNIARAVMAVADEEQAELRAKVERLLEVIGNIGQGYHSDACRTNYAPQGPCNCFQAELRAVLDKHAGEQEQPEMEGYWLTTKPPHGYTCGCPEDDQHREQREWVPVEEASEQAQGGEGRG